MVNNKKKKKKSKPKQKFIETPYGRIPVGGGGFGVG